MKHDLADLRELLEDRYRRYNQVSFIQNDPIFIPHLFSRQQDIEISGFFAAILAWGQRKTIIAKCRELMERMNMAPYDFVLQHREQDLKRLLGFKHRTFNDTDLLYLVYFLHHHYSIAESLQSAFTGQGEKTFSEQKQRLEHFDTYAFSLPEAPNRTRKHLSSPARKSACKRLNMYLRWMVRQDAQGVDFGIWSDIPMADLICPCDVHVERVARKLGLITRKQKDWQMAEELTANLRLLDPHDPVKYDFALFGLGIEEKF
ncbi:TIGR02757 family protein [soil metagenome]